jgi:hypothetical protein
MNNCMHWRFVFTMVLRLKLMVQKVNSYLRCRDAQEARAGTEGINSNTGCVYSNALGGDMAH